MKTDDHLSQMM